MSRRKSMLIPSIYTMVVAKPQATTIAINTTGTARITTSPMVMRTVDW